MACNLIFVYKSSAPKPKYPTHTESTHFAVMTYYEKALFSGGPKLTAIHFFIEENCYIFSNVPIFSPLFTSNFDPP